LLVNLANDSWLGEAKYSEPAFDMIRLRAVEQRRWIVRASTAGPSGFIDPYGRIVARTPLFESTTLSGTVSPLAVVTPYARAGDAFAWACVGTTLLVCRRRRAGRPEAS
jgi:apolipoprotein N-acyltransferase